MENKVPKKTPEKTHEHRRVRMWGGLLRGSFLSILIPLAFLAPLDLRRPKFYYVPAVCILLGFVILYACNHSWRTRWQSALGSMPLKLLNNVITVSILTILLGEFSLTAWDLAFKHPLLAPPSGRSSDLIERNRFPSNTRLVDGSRTNSRGYNDSEWAHAKSPGTIRVLALGDSFAFGCVGYSRNFLTLLEDDLKERVSSRIEVINMGLPGLGPPEYRQLLRTEGLALDPDLILICLFNGNDFVTDRPRTLFRWSDWRLPATMKRLYRLTKDQSQKARSTTLDRDLTSKTDPEDPLRVLEKKPTFSRDSYIRICREYLEVLESTPSASASHRATETLRILDDIIAIASPIPVTIAILPNEVQVDPSWRHQVCASEGERESSLDIFAPAKLLRTHFDTRAIPILDPLPSFLNLQGSESTYLPFDSHWNSRGNQVAAQALSFLIEPSLKKLLDG